MSNETLRICLFSQIHDTTHGPGIQFTAIATTVIGGLSSFIAVFGNALVLYLFFKYERLRNPSNLLLGNLCITDFITGFVVVPTVSIRRITEAYGKGICAVRIVCAYFSYLTVITSVVTVGFISIDRYYAIMKPFRYQRKVSNAKYCIIIITTWMLLAGYSLLPILNILSGTNFFRIACTLMALNIVIFMICYTKISKIVNTHRRKLTCRRKRSTVSPVDVNRKVTLKRFSKIITSGSDWGSQQQSPIRIREGQKTSTIALVVLFTLICYGPLAIVFVLRGVFGDTFELVYLADPWADLIMYLNSTLNPIIYCLRASDIRSALKSVMPARMKTVCR